MKLKDIHVEMEYIARSNLYKFGAKGDNRLMAALCLVMCINHQLDFGNYSIKQFERLNAIDSLIEIDKECMQLLHIQQALLNYSACYDTILQVAYFGFHLAKDFSSEDDYKMRLEQCRWREISSLLKDRKEGTCIDQLYKLLSEHYQNGRIIIADIINNAKHRGGVSLPSLNTYIPDIANCIGAFTLKKRADGSLTFNAPENITVIKSSWFYPLTMTVAQYRDILYLTNNRIYCFISQLLKLMNITPQFINDSDFKIPLDFDTYGTE